MISMSLAKYIKNKVVAVSLIDIPIKWVEVDGDELIVHPPVKMGGVVVIGKETYEAYKKFFREVSSC